MNTWAIHGIYIWYIIKYNVYTLYIHLEYWEHIFVYIQIYNEQYGQNHMAFASINNCFSDPSTWRDITSLAEPTYLPPMKTAGTEGLHPRPRNAHSISLPLTSWSSSWIAGLAPSSQKSDLMLWHMQHELFVKITAAFFDDNSLTISIKN